ncbi:MAG: patatin-like protein [Pacificimonas sp.]
MQEKELRLALVCYGGISLAVYMHGITREIWKLLRASRALTAGEGPPDGCTEKTYYALLEKVNEKQGLRVMVDIIAGASAGGINGIFLAKAISTGRSMDDIVDLWLDHADVDQLLAKDARAKSRFTKLYAVPFLAWLRRGRSRDITDEIVEPQAREEVEMKLSRFVRSRWFQPPFSGETFTGHLLDAVGSIDNGTDGPALLPDSQPLDLFVTVTDFHGYPERLRLHSPSRIIETEHRKTISFRDNGHSRGSLAAEDRDIGTIPSLAFAARATASFPGAFPPFQTVELDRVLKARRQDWPQRDAFLDHVFPHRPETDTRETAPLLDGAILNNAPFRPAIEALRNRPAVREVDRRFVYIDPKPGVRSIGRRNRNGTPDDAPPGFFTTILSSLSDIPREQPIRDDLDELGTITRRVRRMHYVLDGIARSTDAEIDEALGRRTLSSKPSVAKLKAMREQANAAAVDRAGYAYPGYAHLKLADVVETMEDVFAELGEHMDPGPAEDLDNVLWGWIGANGVDEITRTTKPKLAAKDRYVQFLGTHDVGFRIRRLRHVLRQIALLRDDKDVAVRDGAERARKTIYGLLGPFLDRRNRSFFSADLKARAHALPADVGDTIAAFGKEMALHERDEAVDEALSKLLREPEVGPRVRRAILRAWLGFAFYDIATFPIMQGEGLNEYDEIKVDRISPDDATSLRFGGAKATLKGIRFNSFGAFFSRAYRENDYLWGRLHGAERLIDIVLSTLEGDDVLLATEVATLKRDAFTRILDAEEARLTAVPDLIAQLRDDLLVVLPHEDTPEKEPIHAAAASR